MKKYLKYFIVLLFILCSFYVTEKSAIFLRSKDPIMQSIKEYSNEYNVDAVNAQIDDSYIVPGMYGKRINEIKSLMNMKSNNGTFNSLFLETNKIKPDISLEDNKDKIISKGNPNKKAVSFILENDESNIITYLVSNNISASILVKKESVNKNPKFEQINNDFEEYQSVERILNKDKINTNICLIGRNNKDFCIRNKKYLVEPNLVFNSTNMLAIKNNISSGDIVLIKDNVLIDDVAYIIDYIKSKGLSIVKLSELISENA